MVVRRRNTRENIMRKRRKRENRLVARLFDMLDYLFNYKPYAGKTKTAKIK